MHRLAVITALCAIACEARKDAYAPPAGPVYPFLGRWDVTASASGETFPLWFELIDRAGRVEGRFQGRDGHAVPIDAIKIAGAQVRFRVSDDDYTGTFSSDAWQGTGKESDGTTLTWTASRAPDLRPPPDPRWREPAELFTGRTLRGWVLRDASAPNLWKARGGVLANTGNGSDLVSDSQFTDFKLRLEVNVPSGSESGVYLRGRYKVQVQDDYGKLPSTRSMGAIYGYLAPKSNTARPAGDWQELEITLLGRWVTVSLNGRTILDHEEIPGITGGALDSREGEPGPLMLQGARGPVAYRNIVVRPLLLDSALPR